VTEKKKEGHMTKRFSELGIRPADTGKIFNCQQVSITDIINSEVEIEVLFRHTTGSCEEGKFFTNSSSLKSCLDQVAEQNAFPFVTVIKVAKCGKGKIFMFT
jgi:hypothetical protein